MVEDNPLSNKHAPSDAPPQKPATPASKRSRKNTPEQQDIFEEVTRKKQANRLPKLEERPPFSSAEMSESDISAEENGGTKEGPQRPGREEDEKRREPRQRVFHPKSRREGRCEQCR